MTAGFFERSGDRVRIAVRVTPKAGRDSIAGVVTLADGREVLGLRVSVPPADGAANKAVIALLARALAVGKSSLRIVSGETSRLKMIEAENVTDDALLALVG